MTQSRAAKRLVLCCLLKGVCWPLLPFLSVSLLSFPRFAPQVQRVIDDWASAGERLQLAFSWTDPLATGVLLVLMLLLALGLWVVGLQVLVTVGLLWVFRWVAVRALARQHHGTCMRTLPDMAAPSPERWFA